MLAVSVAERVTGLLFVQEAEARVRSNKERYVNGTRIVSYSRDKNREIISGLPADQAHDGVLIADADRDGRLSQFDGVAINGPDMAQGDDIGFVHADELPGWEGLFNIVHSLMGDQRIIRRVDLQVIPAALDIDDLGEADAKEFVIGTDKNVVVGVRIGFFRRG